LCLPSKTRPIKTLLMLRNAADNSVISVLVVLVVSAICSVSETVLYALWGPFVRQIAEECSRSGRKGLY
jgi:hypothetical protein